MTITIHNISKLLEVINLVKTGNKSNSSKVKIGFEQKGIVEGVNYSFFEEISDFCELVSLIEMDDEDYIITELGNKFLENTDSLDSKRNFLILNCIIIFLLLLYLSHEKNRKVIHFYNFNILYIDNYCLNCKFNNLNKLATLINN